MAMKSGSSGRFHKEHMADINVTPMVDVMLVLLVIFMVAAPMMTSGVQVDLPKAAAKPLPGNDEPLTIHIKSDGRVYLQDNPIDVQNLQAKLVAITGEKRDTRIFVRGDQAVDYGRVLMVMGEVNSAGFSKVSLVTDVVPPVGATKPK